MSVALDSLDKLASTPFDGYLVRKDLVRKYARQYPVPTYVVEFLLGRYCASTNEEEINEGLEIVEKQLQDRRSAPEKKSLFKAKAREDGSVSSSISFMPVSTPRTIDYIAELPSLALSDMRIDDDLVHENERMLTDGFYAEVTLAYRRYGRQEKTGRPFKVSASAAHPNVALGRARYFSQRTRAVQATVEWIDFLLRSIGLEPSAFRRASEARRSPAHGSVRGAELQSGRTRSARHGQEPSVPADLALCPPDFRRQGTVAKMFVNNATASAGWSASTTSSASTRSPGSPSTQKDGVNIMKGYMASGEFRRGKESIRADGGIVMVGNFDVDVEQQQRIGHLLPRCRRRCATTRPSWTASTPTPQAGISRSSIRGASHRSLRAGERLPERMLERLRVRKPRFNYARTSSSRRRA